MQVIKNHKYFSGAHKRAPEKYYSNISGEFPIGVMPLTLTETSIKFSRLSALSNTRLKKRSLFSVSLSCKTVLSCICKIVYQPEFRTVSCSNRYELSEKDKEYPSVLFHVFPSAVNNFFILSSAVFLCDSRTVLFIFRYVPSQFDATPIFKRAISSITRIRTSSIPSNSISIRRWILEIDAFFVEK